MQEVDTVKLAQSLRPSFWKREHHLDKMTLKELVVALNIVANITASYSWMTTLIIRVKFEPR